MKTLLAQSLGYNKAANQLVFKLLAKLSIQERTQDRGSFYKSLDGLFAHISAGTVFCIPFIQKATNTNTLKTYDMQNMSLEEQIDLLAEIDDTLIQFSQEADETVLNTSFDFFGRPMTVAGMLLHINIHNTHHRGQISQILDEMKVEHDMIILTDSIQKF